MNVRDIVIAPHRRAVFSTTMRTGIFKDGKLKKQEPGAYRFGYVNVRIFYSAVTGTIQEFIETFIIISISIISIDVSMMQVKGTTNRTI